MRGGLRDRQHQPPRQWTPSQHAGTQTGRRATQRRRKTEGAPPIADRPTPHTHTRARATRGIKKRCTGTKTRRNIWMVYTPVRNTRDTHTNKSAGRAQQRASGGHTGRMPRTCLTRPCAEAAAATSDGETPVSPNFAPMTMGATRGDTNGRVENGSRGSL